MKKITLQILVTFCCLLACGQMSYAQNFTISASAPWVGYMNWFDLSNNYISGGFWGVPALKTTVNPGSNTVTFQPNFNTYADAMASGDPGAISYWTNGAGAGNKIMDALTFVEPAGVGGQNITFQGSVSSNTLSAAYTAVAFIKILDPNIGYAQTAYISSPIGTTGSAFSVSLAIPAVPANLITQYGISIKGINANPANEAALGSIVLGPLFPLSVNVENFTAQVKNQQVDLTWLAKNESNVRGYDIEKSSNGSDFSMINTVLAKNQLSAKYSSTDFLNGVAYYRLKINDQDGKYTYSNVVKAIATQDNSVSVYPNPAMNTLNMQIVDLDATKEFNIFNSFGQQVLNSQISQTFQQVNISQLFKGTYFIQFNSGEVVKFNKQ